MAGIQIKLTVEDRELQQALRKLDQLGRDKSDLFQDIGEHLLNSTQDRFNDQQAPNGEDWQTLESATSDRKTAEGKQPDILIRDGYLRDTLHYETESDILSLGSNLIYAATHQLGDETRGIPARPFLGLSDDDQTDIADIINSDTAMPPYHFRCRTITIAYQPTDSLAETVSHSTYNRERLPKQQLNELLKHAQQAKWQRLSQHQNKHAQKLGITKEAYATLHKRILNQPDRIFTAIRGARTGKPQLVAVKQISGKKMMAIVDIDSNIIRTVHSRQDTDLKEWITEDRHIAIVEQKRGGLLKRL